MSKGIVISLYDYTGEALKPWAKNGYTCYAFDIQHEGWTIESYGNTWSITRLASHQNLKVCENFSKRFSSKKPVFQETTFSILLPAYSEHYPLQNLRWSR